jgi:hypothetical protein
MTYSKTIRPGQHSVAWWPEGRTEAVIALVASGYNGSQRRRLIAHPEGRTMLRILGPQSAACDGVPRRELLRVGALSLFGGLTLPRLLRAADQGGDRPRAAARSVILLNLFGGPSHLDTFDMKPAAPAEVRGEFRPIRTSLPGVQVCEHLPRIARRLHRTCLIRTVSHRYNSHNPYSVLTGFTGGDDRDNYYAKPTDHPSVGAVCQYLGAGRPGVPAHVVLPALPGYSQGLRRAGPYGGYLGKQYDPLISVCTPRFARKGSFYDAVLPEGEPVLPGLGDLPDVTAGRLGGRRSLLQQVDRRLARLSAARAVDGLDRFQRQAFALLTAGKVRNAFDLGREPPRVRDRYGRHLYGASLLIARRLAEAGSTFVTVNWECAADTHGGHWDMHENNFGMLRFNLPLLDQMVAALLDDLEDRGLLASTLVVVTGEMGRSPRVNAKAGRDHWPQCGFCLLAGGGVKAGLVHGVSDKQAAYPTDHPVSPGDLVATVYHLLGVDYRQTVADYAGRPISITHGGEPVWKILS